MDEEILKLAKECEVWQDFGGGFESIRDFYKAAYNKAIEDALYIATSTKCYDAIRELEMK